MVDIATGLTIGPVEIVDLVEAVERRLSTPETRPILRRARGYLREHGVPDDLLDAIDAGLETGEWDDAVAEFAGTRRDPSVFYLGPIRAREGDPAVIGMILGRRDAIASGAFSVVRDSAEDIGRMMFGFPCSFHAREVEFFKLDAAAGGTIGTAEAPIALFTPFYLGGWSDRDRQAEGSRTILWSNVVTSRHLAIARPVAERGFLVDDALPSVLNATVESLDACAGLWLSLHELFHSSGPLPLFESASGKSNIPGYGVVEEARVDMSAFLAMARQGAADTLSRTTAELILLERLLRSARCGAAEMVTGADPSLDGQHGLLWARVLKQAGAVRPTGGSEPIRVDFDRAVAAVSSMLSDIYRVESATVDAPETRRAELCALADRTHAIWLADGPPGGQALEASSVDVAVMACLKAGPLVTA